MKIAITSDVHLTKKGKHPERWQTLKNLLKDLRRKETSWLIIAGDLFNDDFHNYSEFDELASDFKDIKFIIIPGNHDPDITQKAFTSDNITIYDKPEIIDFDNSSLPFLFLPFKKKVSMGEEIVSYMDSLPENEWILIGHGDWADTIKAPNPVEPGIYMPLSRKDIKDYSPALTLLGHIHKPMDDTDSNVYYPGSPCGLDIRETGRRRYLILDTDNFQPEPVTINSEVLYFDETIVVYPMENEEDYWENEVKKIKDKWDLTAEEKSKTVIRVKVKGYSSNKRKLKEYFDSEFEDFSFWDGEGVDVTEVSTSDNYELLKIIERASERINELELEEKRGEPTRKEILAKAIKRIYSIE